jgi:hypothetical protein
MPRPTNKKELLELSLRKFNELGRSVELLPRSKQVAEFPAGTMNRNIRDVLAHLHHWHLMFLGWYALGMEGKRPAMPAIGYTWATLPDLNKAIWEKYRKVPLGKVQKELQTSFEDVRSVIERHTDDELFEKKRYPWTGSTSMGAYLVSVSSSHYDWALKLIKKATK